MDTNLCSFALCQFVPSWFFLSKWSAFEKKSFSTTLHVVFPFHVSSQVSRYLDRSFQWSLSLGNSNLKKKKRKQNSNILYIFVKYFWISLPSHAKKNLLQHLVFAKHTFGAPFGAQQSSLFHLYRFLSLFYGRCAPFRAWKCSQARPAALRHYGSPLSAVSSTCRETTWENRYEFKQEFRRTRPGRHSNNAQFLMGTSWSLRVVLQCRKSIIHGGWVCLWVASC